MKANKLFIGLATIAATTQMFMACSSDDMTNQSGVMNGNNKAISLTSSFETMRGTTDPQTTQLNTAVKVGAFGVTGSTTITNGNNNQYSVAANGDLSATNEMTWPTEGDVNIYAYAPYQENWTYNTANNFTVATNQATDADYLASDLVYGIPTSNPVSQTENRVALSFKHKLAKLNITIQKAQESTLDLSAGKVTITNTKIATTLNPSTGVVGDASGDATDITAVSALGEATTACAIIVPQDIAAGTRLVKIEADSKILYAKLGTATTFEGGKSYNFTVNVGNVTEPEVEVTLQLGSTAVANWEDQDLGAADTEEEIGIGDYVLADGTLVKNANLTEAQKTNVIAIVFSTTPSATDAAAGYAGYAMGVKRIGASGGTKKQWYVNTSYGLGADNLTDGFADMDGLTKTNSIKSNNIYTTLETKTEHIANLDNYSVSIDGSATNLSGWFTPSFGQLIAILNNLGEAGINAGIAKEFKNNSQFYISTSQSTWASESQEAISISDVFSKINAYLTNAGKSGIISVGNIDIGTVTENTSSSANGQKFWQFSVKDDGSWELTAAQAKVGSGGVKEVCVIPCVAFKLPTE